jgi:hypothetical protein
MSSEMPESRRSDQLELDYDSEELGSTHLLFGPTFFARGIGNIYLRTVLTLHFLVIYPSYSRTFLDWMTVHILCASSTEFLSSMNTQRASRSCGLQIPQLPTLLEWCPVLTTFQDVYSGRTAPLAAR